MSSQNNQYSPVKKYPGETNNAAVAGQVFSSGITALSKYWTQTRLEQMKQEQNRLEAQLKADKEKLQLTLQQQSQTATEQLLSQEKKDERDHQLKLMEFDLKKTIQLRELEFKERELRIKEGEFLLKQQQQDLNASQSSQIRNKDSSFNGKSKEDRDDYDPRLFSHPKHGVP